MAGSNKKKKIYGLKDKLGFGKEHPEDTIEEIIDTDIKWMEWALSHDVITVTEEVKKYYTQKAVL